MRATEPDEKSRATVGLWSHTGFRDEDIAKVIGIDDKTLRRHYNVSDQDRALLNRYLARKGGLRMAGG